MSLKSLEIATKKLSNPKEIERLIILAAKPNEQDIINLNISQLEQGLLSDGDKTQEYASIGYTNFKSGIGSKSVPNADLKVTGKFYKGWKVKYLTTSFTMNSTDSKAPALEAKYTKDIYGLTDPNKGVASRKVAPNFVKLIRNVFKK